MGTPKPKRITSRISAISTRPTNEVRAELAEHEAERIDRRDQQLLERAALALAHDRDRGEHDGHDLQQHRDEAGDDVVRGPAVGVEQDDRLRRERAPARDHRLEARRGCRWRPGR